MENDDTRFYHDENTVIVDHKPEDGETVDVTTNIEVYFTRDINVNTLEGNFHVINKDNDNSVPGDFEYDKNNSKVIYSLDLLEENTPYKVYIDGVEDLSGDEIPEFIFEFRTDELNILDKHPPRIVEPTNNTVVEEPKIAWTTFNNYEGNYDLEISTDDRFSNLVYNVETSETEIIPNIEYGETYHARVKYNDNISESLAKDEIEIKSTSDDMNYVYFDNYFKYDYGERIYSISHAYIKSGEYLDVVDSGQSSKGKVYIKENESDNIVIDKKLSEDDIIVIELYYYVESDRKWSDTVSFYVKDLDYGDLDSVFDDNSDTDEEGNFIDIIKPENTDLVSPSINSIRLKINSDIIEKENININISGIANNVPEFQEFSKEKIDGSIENFNQKNGYTVFDYIFKYKDKGSIGRFIIELKKALGSSNTFNTLKYNDLGLINNFTTLIINSLGNTNLFTTPSEVDTTEPYSVYNASDLKRIGTGENGWDLSSSYIQENDIDVSETIEPLDYNLSGNFTGTYDGNGYKINNLTINKDKEGLGLVSINNGVIKNLVINNPDITNNSNTTGVIAGINKNTIEKVGVINGTVNGVNNVGGIAGINDGVIKNSYARTSINGDDTVGGLIGHNISDTSKVDDVYSASTINANTNIGGLTGSSSNYLDDTECFWDIDIGPDSNSNGGNGKTTSEMKDYDTYSFWNIGYVNDKDTPSGYTWSIVDGSSYPFLF